MPSGNAPLTSYLSQGTISNYDPSWRDKAAYWLAQNWYGDNREGVQKANRLMNVADVTPVGIPLALDDAARSFGHGNYAGGAVTLAMAGIPAVRKEAKLTGKAAQDTLNSIMAKHGLAAPTKRFEYAPMYRPPGHETVPAGFVEFGPPSQKHKFGTVVYDKPLSIKDEDAFELVPLDPNHPKNLKKEYDQFHADFQDKFSAQNETFEAVNGKDRVIVTPSVRQDGWQVTKFDGDIPTGHSEHSDFDELAREMWSHYKSGFKPASEATTATNPVLSAILEKHGLTEPIKAYHNSPYDFEQFDPSKSYRKSSFFAASPEAAQKGASGGAGDMYGTRPPATNMYEVEIDPSRIEGLSLTPSEQDWFKSLPDVATEDQVTAIQKSLPSNFDYWWRVYDEVDNGDGTFKYIKKPIPSVSYEDAAKSGKDVYGRQFPHYGGQESAIAEKVKSRGMSGYTIQDEAGLSLAVVDPTIVKILKKYGLDQPQPKTIRAYHGSPHSFDKFDMSKIGTGEGAQAYGHGLYFAENEGVAKNYRDALAGAGKVVTNRGAFDTQKKLARIAKKYGDDLADEVKESLRMVTTGEMSLDDAKSYWLGEATRSGYGQDVYASIFRDAKHLKNTGSMYEVQINADPEQFLDWDKPLSEQPESVRKAFDIQEPLPVPPIEDLQRLAKERGVALRDLPEYKAAEDAMDANRESRLNASWTGSDLYSRLRMDASPEYHDAATWDKTRVNASEHLKAKGIPGIKYLDQGSRVQGRFSQQLDDLRNKLAVAESKLAEATNRGRRHSAMVHSKEVDDLRNKIALAEKPQSRNYVVFDERLITILRKYGLLPPIAAGAAYGASQDQQQPAY